MKIALITGSNGHLGGRLKSIFENRYELITINYSEIKKDPGKNFSILNFEDLGKKTQIELLVHCGANRNKNDSEIYIDNVVNPLILINNLCENNNLKRVINFDTSLDEQSNHYAKSKDIFSKKLKILAKEKEIQVDNIILEILYSIEKDTGCILDFLFGKIYQMEQSIDMSTCEQYRDFIEIEDVIGAVELIESNHQKNSGWTDYWITTEKPKRLMDIIQKIIAITNSNIKVKFNENINANERVRSISLKNVEKLKSYGWLATRNVMDDLAVMAENRRSSCVKRD